LKRTEAHWEELNSINKIEEALRGTDAEERRVDL